MRGDNKCRRYQFTSIVGTIGYRTRKCFKKTGIEVKSALPGVGENLRDHYAPRMKWSTLKGRYTYNDRARGIGMALEIAKYFTTGRGFLAMPAAPMRAYVRSREGLVAPDLGISVNPFLIKTWSFSRQK